MIENCQEQKSIKEKVLKEIESGKIKMRPRAYFLFKILLISAGAFLVGGLILFLISLIHFNLRVSGVQYLPGFGFHGVEIYFKSLPWLLIFSSVFLVLVLEILAKQFSFVWRRPIFYSLLVIILAAIIGGGLIDRTPFHPSLFMKIREGRLPLMAPVYREFGTRYFKDVHRGIVEELTENGFLLRKSGGELITVVFGPGKRPSIKQGDSVVVMGEQKDNAVQIQGILKIDDEFRPFERRLPPFPMK